MADLLSTGAAHLSAMRKQFTGRTVTYRRGVQSATLTATKGASSHQRSDKFGAVVRVKSVDFLITAADLVLNGSAITPQKGDRIEEVLGGSTVIYEVLPFGEDPCWRWSDEAARTTIRVHTKEIS